MGKSWCSIRQARRVLLICRLLFRMRNMLILLTLHSICCISMVTICADSVSINVRRFLKDCWESLMMTASFVTASIFALTERKHSRMPASSERKASFQSSLPRNTLQVEARLGSRQSVCTSRNLSLAVLRHPQRVVLELDLSYSATTKME